MARGALIGSRGFFIVTTGTTGPLNLIVDDLSRFLECLCRS
jgi:hypothetical protein